MNRNIRERHRNRLAGRIRGDLSLNMKVVSAVVERSANRTCMTLAADVKPLAGACTDFDLDGICLKV